MNTGSREAMLDLYACGRMKGRDDGMRLYEEHVQRFLVQSTTFPVDIEYRKGYDPRAVLEQAGVKFLGHVEGDDLFQYVELPEGWRMIATIESTWSHLVDGEGRIIAKIFYKTAIYDRRATMYMSVDDAT